MCIRDRHEGKPTNETKQMIASTDCKKASKETRQAGLKNNREVSAHAAQTRAPLTHLTKVLADMAKNRRNTATDDPLLLDRLVVESEPINDSRHT